MHPRELAVKMEFREVRDATQSFRRQGLFQVLVNEIEHAPEALGIGLFSFFLG